MRVSFSLWLLSNSLSLTLSNSFTVVPVPVPVPVAVAVPVVTRSMHSTSNQKAMRLSSSLALAFRISSSSPMTTTTTTTTTSTSTTALHMTTSNDDEDDDVGSTTTITSTTTSTTSPPPPAAAAPAAAATPPPVLNGKMVLPLPVVQKGLEGHQVAAVYALIGHNDENAGYKRGTDGWKQVIKVGTTLDLWATLLKEGLQSQSTSTTTSTTTTTTITHVRALSFIFPQQDAMKDVAQQWEQSVVEAGGTCTLTTISEDNHDNTLDETDDLLRRAQLNAMSAFDDDEFDDDDDDDIEMMIPPPPSSGAGSNDGDDDDVLVSPFAEGASTTVGKDLPFTAESVNIVLDEVRPYLIADGGNVSVDRVDEETKNVYLKLEGACGSCASSTVTMQMGIERVLKENFADLGQVIQVDNGEEKPSELTMDMVMVEVNRIGPAIFAMGGQYELVNVDPLGVVELKFKGPNKLQQGLELALLDIPLCKHVKFTMFDE